MHHPTKGVTEAYEKRDKHNKKICIWLLMMIAVVGCLVLPVHAAETEVTIDLDYEYTEAVFYVTWEIMNRQEL